jgi:aspartate racemase
MEGANLLGRYTHPEIIMHTPETLVYFKGVIDELKNKGCDAVVLGCTEIPLLITQEDSSLPILDSTRLLARAALKKAISSTSG